VVDVGHDRDISNVFPSFLVRHEAGIVTGGKQKGQRQLRRLPLRQAMLLVLAIIVVRVRVIVLFHEDGAGRHSLQGQMERRYSKE
jgi:hypothetical protein